MAPKHNVSTFVLDCGDGNVWVILSLHTQGVELMPKSLILASSDHSTFSQAFSESFRCSLANLRRTCTCAFLSRVTLRALRSSVLGDCGPNCLQINNKLLPWSFGLIHHLWHDYPHFMRQDLALSSRWRDMSSRAHLQYRPWHSWTSLWSHPWLRRGWNGRNWLCGLVCWAHSQSVGSNIYFTQWHANIFVTFMCFSGF